ncbi:MAG: metalloregulator ArsR/SmtB family transcription factor [Candidatus Cloacimonetes bacterium]|nr:metalloregulator ArsR/SmtB family transcription factor [Candidatus Cloacimonadota bacterium]
MDKYNDLSKLFKVLSDPTRIQILDILSCGTLCACDILESLRISQSTLSHHMKVLMDCGLVIGEKKSTWMHYSLDQARVKDLHDLLDNITLPKENCICNSNSEENRR